MVPLPLVSIVVPVHNVEAYLIDCLKTIRSQTLREIEILCVDDASRDGSLRILTQQAELDSRIRVISHDQNLGLSAARNTGLKEARAPWVVFIDSDDLVSTYLCEHCLKAAECNNADVVFFSYESFNDGEAPPDSPPAVEAKAADRNALLLRNAFAWTKFTSTDFLRSRKVEFPLGLCLQDIPVHWRLVLESQTPIFLDEPLVWYRQRASSISYRTDWTRADGFKVYDIVRKYLHTTKAWDKYSEVFVRRELEIFTDIYIKFACTNSKLLSRAHGEILKRMTGLHWEVALKNVSLPIWRRDYILACCRPKYIKPTLRQLVPVIRHIVRATLRPIWHRMKKLF